MRIEAIKFIIIHQLIFKSFQYPIKGSNTLSSSSSFIGLAIAINPMANRNSNIDSLLRRNIPNNYNPNLNRIPTPSVQDALALQELENRGITYEDLAALLYGNR